MHDGEPAIQRRNLDLPREESHEAERKRRKLTWSMWGGWRQDGKKAECVKLGDLSGGESLTGVRAPVVAMKCRNWHGAKERRKVET